jgi:3-oxoacid CoA-transferase B subunit
VTKERLDEQTIAMRAAKEFQDGMVVNLGMGIPMLCTALVPEGREVLFHSENGVLGFGATVQDPAEASIDLLNAQGQPVYPKPGMCFVDHSDSFVMIRGGHVDITVLGALQVSEQGDLANWRMPGKQVGSLGGGMDLAFRAKKVIVCMTHTAKDGRPKIVRECSLPLTAPEAVDLIVTDLAVVEVTPDGLLLKEVAPGWTPHEVQELTDAPLAVAQDVREIDLVS